MNRAAFLLLGRTHFQGAVAALVATNGGLIRTLVDGPQSAGAHAITWDGRDDRGRAAPAGMYVIRMEAGDFSGMHKALLVR